jgi:hypothetical protein
VNDLDFPLLTAIVLLPAVGAAVIAALPKARADAIRLVAALASLATGVLTVVLAVEFEAGEAGYQFVSQHSWIEDFGVSWILGVDGISLFLVVLTGVLFPLTFVAVEGGEHPQGERPGGRGEQQRRRADELGPAPRQQGEDRGAEQRHEDGRRQEREGHRRRGGALGGGEQRGGRHQNVTWARK